MNEWELISFLKGELSSKVELSIGDDAAVIKEGDKYFIITKDLMVENTHFILNDYPLALLGKKLVNSNISDIVAMGAYPKYALLGITIREGLGDEALKIMLTGVKEELENAGVSLIGGDTVKGRNLMLSMTVIGETKRYITRKGAQPENLIFLSGKIGYSRAGLREFLSKGIIENSEAEKVFFEGKNRRDLLDFLSEVKINAMIDISDGFYQDLNHILESSEVGAEIYLENLPYDSYLEKLSKEEGVSYYDFVLNSGEEYELIIIVPSYEEERLIKKGLIEIGKIKGERELTFIKDGKKVNVRNLSYTHKF